MKESATQLDGYWDINNPFVPKKLNDVLKKCLAFDPEERYENGGRLVCDLRKLI